MLATTRQRILHINDNNLDVHIGDYKLVQSDCIDYLGVKIDETISWNKQTDNICKKLVFIISRFSRLKHNYAPLSYAYAHLQQYHSTEV